MLFLYLQTKEEKQETMRYDLPLTSQVKTRLPAFAKPYAGKKPRVLFVNGVKHGREAAELMQLAELEAANVTFDKEWDLNKWGFGDFYDKRGDYGNQEIMLRNLEEALCSDTPYDCIVLPAINGWNGLTPATRQAIRDRVAAGAGLVLVHPMEGVAPAEGVRLAEVSPLVPMGNPVPYSPDWYGAMARGTWLPQQPDHPVVRGIPFALLPCDRLSYSPYESAGETLIASPDGMPIAAVKRLGKGRVVAFGYYSRDFLPQHADYRGRDGCFNPITDTWLGAALPEGWNFMEAFYKLAARAIYWCAGAEAGIDGADRAGAGIDGAGARSDGIDGAGVRTGDDAARVGGIDGAGARTGGDAARVGEIVRAEAVGDRLLISHTAGGAELYAELWNAFGERVMERRPMEGGSLLIPEALRAAGGTLRAELSLETEDGVCDFYTAVVVGQPEATSLSVELSLSECRDGDTVTATVRLSGSADTLEVGLVDDYGRLLAQRVEIVDPAAVEEDGAAAVLRIDWPVRDILSGHIHAAAVALKGGRTAARARSADCVVAPLTRKLDDFEVFMNPQNRGQGDLLAYVNELFPQAGMTGNFIGDNRVTAMSGAHGLGVYWYNRRPYVENKERWLETGDKRYLVREPCLNNEGFWNENREHIHANVERQRKYGPIAYFAQDEGSLTCYSDEMDFCFCELCLADMRVWLRSLYGTLEALNASWETSYADWAEAVPLTREEARRSGVWTSWADHRTYMERVYTDAYRRMRTYIRERDPDGEVRMSGCQASTAYTGNDYDLLHEHVRYFEAYPVGGQYEFHRSFKHPDTILGGWFGYGADGDQARHSVWNAVFHGLTLCSIFWEYAMLNPDFSFSRSARDFGEVFREIRREGIGKLLLYAAETSTLGIAVHYSMSSVHGTNIAGHKTFFEQNRVAWCELLEDAGAQYRYLSTRQIESGALDAGDVRLLILPYSLALSAEEAAAIERYTAAGGVVLGDVQTGLLDGHCRRLESGALDRLFGIRRLRTDWEPFSQDGEYSVDPAFSYFELGDELSGEEGPGVPRAELGVRAAGGVRAFSDPFSGHGASLVVHPYGEGYGVYLNFAAQPYSRMRREGAGAGLRAVVGKVLGLAGIDRPMAVTTAEGEPLSGLESFYYALGTGRVFAVKREVGATGVKYDGLAKNSGGSSGDKQRIRVAFRESGHLYDIREKRYLGCGSETEGELGEGDAKLYALLPYRAEQLTLTRVGDNEFEAALQVEGPAPERTVIAVQVTRPDGTYSSLYSRNYLMAGGSLRFSVPFAMNEGGVWRLAAKDVPTGVSAELDVPLEAATSAVCPPDAGNAAP